MPLYPVLLGALAFTLVAPCGGPLIQWLRANGVGKRIRADGPERHQSKMGTPTMGGLLIVVPATLAAIGLAFSQAALLICALTIVAYGLLGAADDAKGLTNDRNAPLAPQLGILAHHMFLYQTLIALVIAALLYVALDISGFALPQRALPINLGVAFIPAATFVIVAMCNAVNLTDGLDGLAGSTAATAYLAYAVIAYAQQQHSLAALCLITTGAVLGFLWHNAHPATVFMGGVGSIALGGLLAVVAILTEQWMPLPIIGVVFLAEVLSDVIQIGWFKLSRRLYGQGRRVFRMAPLHHHFELHAWPETKIVQRFWIIGVLGACVGTALALW